MLRSRKVLWSALKFRVQLQRAVSMNKRRFVQAGGGGAGQLDLDLTYVCDRLIAMAIPCVEGAVYRNDIREVSERPPLVLHPPHPTPIYAHTHSLCFRLHCYQTHPLSRYLP